MSCRGRLGCACLLAEEEEEEEEEEGEGEEEEEGEEGEEEGDDNVDKSSKSVLLASRLIPQPPEAKVRKSTILSNLPQVFCGGTAGFP